MAKTIKDTTKKEVKKVTKKVVVVKALTAKEKVIARRNNFGK